MAKKNRPDVSWINPDAIGTNKQKFLSAVKTISETTETRKNVGEGPSLIAAVGAKYKQNPTNAIAKFKQSFIAARGINDVPISWRTSGGVKPTTKTVNPLYRPSK